MNISKEEFIKKYCEVVNEDIKYPIYGYKKFDKETNMYFGLEILKTLEELEKEQLELEASQENKPKVYTNEELQKHLANMQDMFIAVTKTL